jgi:hypothetical protein
VDWIFHKQEVDVMRYEYKAVPFTGIVESFSPSQVAQQLSQSIDIELAGDWEFYQINSVNINVSPGCLAALSGAKSSTTKHDMLIFRRVVQLNLDSEEVKASLEAAEVKRREERAQIVIANESEVRRLERNGYRFIRFDEENGRWIFVASNMMEFSLNERELKELSNSFA